MISREDFLSHIRAGKFRELFITHLGWDRWVGQANLPLIHVDDTDFQVRTIAARNSFQILFCEVDDIPSQSLAKKIDSKLRRQSAADYICIYRKRGEQAHDLWCVPVRSNERRDLVMVEYQDARADMLYSKIEGFAFGIDEETNLVDLRAKVQGAFAVNAERITRDFYTGFRKQHKAFAKFITGIDDEISADKNRNKQWYTSVMLNRLMFCYFIQKKGFLDLNHKYLHEKLLAVQREQGENRFFQTFYRGFLSGLFHNGLNSPGERNEAFRAKYGRIPYLNGGMFDEHQIEHDYANIDIADEAFVQLFQFFDTWNWHLDTRITATGRDINPDVLGYIFEQYINDRAQMGAYYTKEDITEYIGRNCILPFLFDKVAAASSSAKDFAPDGYVWQTLRQSGQRYVFDTVKKGVDLFNEIPAEIKRGIITEAMRHDYSEVPVGQLPPSHTPLASLRADWNRPTPELWALPTEIWRETIDRLQRCRDLLTKIASGAITSINDFITYNLDIRTFALDLIAEGNHAFVSHFYAALTSVTVLDPTCGSGAFLFAAMNILEPLYEACIERMQTLHEANPKHFKEELNEINGKYRSNIQYFIFKSIILRNLYGVDIMVEAAEIAKLRLFLKMVAVVDVDRRAENLGLDPLPDIDFNIRCGNTLVGYANQAELDRDLADNQGSFEVMCANDEFRTQINTEMQKVAAAYNQFKAMQLKQDEDMATFKQAKHDLRQRLTSLNDVLNHRLHQASNPTIDYNAWLASHQPFNWLAEFYGIIQGNGGFDVIIGNPPYVEYARRSRESGLSIRDIYQLNNYKTLQCGNLYAFVTERSCVISNNRNNIGFIVPLTLASNNNMAGLRDYITEYGTSWYSHYEIRPGRLFEGAEQRLTIFLIRNTVEQKVYSTAIQRWHNEHRALLFKQLSYASSFNRGSIWRTSSRIETDILNKFFSHTEVTSQLRERGAELHYRTAGVRYWIIFLNQGFGTTSLSNKKAFFEEPNIAAFYMAAFNSNLFWWYYALNFDMFNLKDYMIFNFHLNYTQNPIIINLANRLEKDLHQNKVAQSIISRTRGNVSTSYFQKKLSKPIIDEIDAELAKHYGFSEEELDFIINYDIKYRMGDELNNDEAGAAGE